MKVTDTKSFIEKSKLLHGDKYDYSDTVFTKSRDKVSIRCKNCGELFNQNAGNHCNAGNGCPQCSGKISKRRLSIEERISNARDLHGDKFDYSEWGVKTSKEVGKVTCTKHHISWNISYDNHVNQGKECPSCRYEKSSLSKNMGYIEAERIISTKFNHITIHEDSYKSFTTSCNFTCDIHGLFHKTPQLVSLSVYGCSECAKDNGSYGNDSLSQEDFFNPISVRLPHCDFSNSIYINQTSEVTFYCNKHGKYHTTKAQHLKLSSKGCVDCSIESSSRKQVGFLNNTIVERNKSKYLNKENFLYIVRLPDLSHNVYKIGMACIPVNRYYKLKKDFGKLDIIKTYPLDTYNCFKLEQSLHRLFSDNKYTLPNNNNIDGSRKRGINELFKLDREDIINIDEYISIYKLNLLGGDYVI